jgi:hypothetical protein
MASPPCPPAHDLFGAVPRPTPTPPPPAPEKKPDGAAVARALYGGPDANT